LDGLKAEVLKHGSKRTLMVISSNPKVVIHNEQVVLASPRLKR
jgi:hypothetical protein